LQLAVLAEFRQDWLAAVSSYQSAAAALQGVPLGRPTVSCQRHAEVAAVAEVVHFKAMMLLLHQQRYGEAIQQLRGHLAAFGPLPGTRALCCDVLSRMVLQWMLGTCYLVTAAECNTVSAVLLLFFCLSHARQWSQWYKQCCGVCCTSPIHLTLRCPALLQMGCRWLLQLRTTAGCPGSTSVLLK
jgi:hypothetical protein